MCNAMRPVFILLMITVLASRCDDESNPTSKPVFAEDAYLDTLADKASVIFVQWNYPKTMNWLDALDIRQRTELLLDKSLRSDNLGERMGGDLGPGGANMLFEVTDISRSLKLILKTLQESNIYSETLIAIDNGNPQRGARPSNFIVVYPKNYNGVFNDL